MPAKAYDATQLQYGNLYLPSEFSDILLNNFFYNSFLQPGITYTNKYQKDSAGQVFVPKIHTSEVKLGMPCGDFEDETINNELLQITQNNSYRQSKKIYDLQAIVANYGLVNEVARLSAKEMAEAWNKSALAALIHESPGQSMESKYPSNLNELKHDLLSARTQMYKNKRDANIVVCSPDFYQLILEYAGTLFTPTINDRMFYAGEVGTWLGLRFINMNLLQYNAGPFKYRDYTWDEHTISKEDIENIGYILYDPEAFSVLVNFNKSRMIPSETFNGVKVQNEMNSGFRVTDPQSVFVRGYKNSLIDFNKEKQTVKSK